MTQNRLLKNISANTLQLIINQVFGLLIFYVLSKGLEKAQFGELNWALAVLLTAFALMTFGIDQLLVKKIAAGDERQPVFAAYLFHVVISGGLFYCLLIACYFLFPAFFHEKNFLLFVGVGKLFIYFSTAFKQVATGLEKFTALLYMSVVSNIIRGVGLLILYLTGNMSVTNVLIIFIAGDVIEFIVCVVIAWPLLQPPLKIRWNKELHLNLFKEALPQAGVVLFTGIMARFDWILIGLFSTSVKLAEYSFAWKMFEVSTLPLLIIAPLMIPMFTRILKQKVNATVPSFFLEWQIITASFIALLLNLVWVPLIDLITDGRYGAVNRDVVFILSLAMPLLYFNNYLWTINFAQGKLKRIFFIMGISFLVNIIACSILIPMFGNEGAAVANLAGFLLQTILYAGKSDIKMERQWTLALWPLIAFACGMSGKYLPAGNQFLLLPALVFVLAVIISRQFKKKDWKELQGLYS